VSLDFTSINDCILSNYNCFVIEESTDKIKDKFFNVLSCCCFSPHAPSVNTEFRKHSVSSRSLNLESDLKWTHR